MNSRSVALSWRLYIVAGLLLAGLLALVARLLFLQLDSSDRGREFLQHQGEIRVIRNELIPASRGEILDRNGKLLAYSTPVQSLWVNPSKLDASKEDLRTLAHLLSMSTTELQKRIASHDSYVFLRRRVEPALAAEVVALGLEGLHTETEYKRYYPAAEFASHLLGFTDVDDRGQEGMELAFNDLLMGHSGKRQVMRNAIGETIKHIRLLKAPEPGESLQLSIDMNLQYIAYRELKAAVQQHGARSGSMVVLDAQTGEVLALVNQPSYNVNDRSQLQPELTRNRALIDVFEPGSTVKPFTMAAALESSRVNPNSLVNTSPGYLRLDGKTFVDPKNYGELTVTDVLAKSSQVGTIKLALGVDISDLRDMFAQVGFGEYCATGFPGEQVGFLPSHKRWLPVQQATLAFGHGMSVNTLQLARAYSVLAADGVKRSVSLLKKTEAIAAREVTEQVMQPELARSVRQMMTAVVESGTGQSAQIPGYSVAGKTGTSHKVGREGYQQDRYRATFAGMVPADNPRLVAVVTINDPRSGQYFGGEITAPVFASVMRSALRMLAVSPDKPQELDSSYARSQRRAGADEAA